MNPGEQLVMLLIEKSEELQSMDGWKNQSFSVHHELLSYDFLFKIQNHVRYLHRAV